MKQRNITLYDDVPWVPAVYDYNHNPSFTPSPSTPATRTYYARGTSFTAVDEACSDAQHGRRVWHPFSHYKKTAVPAQMLVFDNTEKTGNPSAFEWYEGNIPQTIDMFRCSQFGTASSPTVGLPAMSSIVDGPDIRIPDPEDLDSLLGSSFLRMLPGIKPDLSIINSIIELKDMKTLRETFTHAEDILNRLTKLNNLRRSAFVNLSFRDILRRRSSDYLQLKFNLQPLYSDIKGVFDAFRSWSRKTMLLLAQAEKLNTHHISININEYDTVSHSFESSDWHVPDLEFGTNFYQLIRSSKSHRKVSYAASQFHLEMEFQYTFSKLQREHARLFTLMDQLGVNLNPAIVWNAIPYSFVVDWVLGVNKYLNTLAVREMEPAVNIRRCLWSIKRSRSIECSFDLLYGPAANPASTVTEDAYKRVLCWPSPASLIASGLSSTEVSLGAALVFSRRPRHRNP